MGIELSPPTLEERTNSLTSANILMKIIVGSLLPLERALSDERTTTRRRLDNFKTISMSAHVSQLGHGVTY